MKIQCDNKNLVLHLDGSGKNSMLVLGESRMGKTFFVSNLANCLLQSGYLIHLIDLGDKWGEGDKERLRSAGATVQHVDQQGATLTFGSMKELLGSSKYIVNAVGLKSTDAIAVLKKVLAELGQIKSQIRMKDIADKLKALGDSDEGDNKKEWGKRIYDRLEGLGDIPDIRLCVGIGSDFSMDSTIWDLSDMDDTYVQITAQLILYCLLCYQRTYFEKRRKLMFTIIDEFQTMDSNRKSITGVCLTEGQKYGLNLILITQFLSGNFSEGLINQFKQGGFRFYFRLTEEEAAIVSRQLVGNSDERKALYLKLSTLPRGQCLMIGLHSIGNRREISEKFRLVEIIE